MMPGRPEASDGNPASRQWFPGPDSERWPLAGLTILLLAQASLVFTRSVHWDEYYFYNQVAEYRAGLLRLPLQTLHVRFFEWLPGLFPTSTDHIVAARLTMLACEMVTLAMLYLLACRFTNRSAALFAPLLYLSAGYVLQHGMAFRIDPMLTALLTASLVVLARSRLDTRSVVLFGLLTGTAGMVSVKAVLYLTCFGGVALLRWHEAGWSRAMFVRLLACGAAGVIVLILIYLFHSQDVSDPAAGEQMLSSASRWMFFSGLIPPYWTMALKAVLTAPLLYAVIAVAPFFIWSRSPRPLGEKLALTGLWLPVLTVFFYTNTAPYYYAYMLAPVAVAASVVIDWVLQRVQPLLVTVALASIALTVFAAEDRSTISRQRQLERNVYAIFPQPVGYFDHNSMLGGWPKANGFMTPWLMNAYRERGEAEYSQAMQARAVPLLLGNWWTIRVMLLEGDDSLLVPQDNVAMRETYIEFAPYIFIAGKELPPRTDERAERFRVPGLYTVRDAAMMVNGTLRQPGEVVNLERGTHSLAVPGDGPARLVWGDRLREPADPLTPGPLYAGS